MPASLIITNSGIPGVVPDPEFLDTGELALNWADKALYFKDTNDEIQTITSDGPLPQVLATIPVDEGPWTVFEYTGAPANTAYNAVQKAAGDVPSLAIYEIATGANLVEVTGTDVLVSVVAGTTAEELRVFLEADASFRDLIYFYNAPGSDGTGIVTPEAMPADPLDITYTPVDAISGTRADRIGQPAIVIHVDSSFTEWSAAAVEPTQWIPKSPNLLYNRTDLKWERMFVQGGTVQTEDLP